MINVDTEPVVLGTQVAVDIGSTIVKIAQIDADGVLLFQRHYPRDFQAGIAAQVETLLDKSGSGADPGRVLVCSSANGGLRVGIVCLTPHFSGTAYRNQVLLAGANPVFVHDLDDPGGNTARVDLLLVGGGIDCADASPLAKRLAGFDPARYRFGTLAYAGNSYLAADFQQRHPRALIVANPLGVTLSSRVGSVFEAVRRAYLDDLIYKEGVSELRGTLAHGIRPTPEVVSRGFLRAVLNKSSFAIVGACMVLDIGGATTDLHYTVELVREDSQAKPAAGVSVARHVFTDLGIVASRDTLVLQLRAHPRLYEFLSCVLGDDAHDVYRSFREDEYEPTPSVLSYACIFLALYRFANERDPGLPAGDLNTLAQIILTGGAAQSLDEPVIARVVGLVLAAEAARPLVQVDREYRLWVDGLTWTADAPT